jgi:3-deoxy-7-phosphoheptulonate synthase
MLESFLVAGRQEADPGHSSELAYGQSITDACLDWERSVGVLDGLAEAVRARRSSAR